MILNRALGTVLEQRLAAHVLLVETLTVLELVMTSLFEDRSVINHDDRVRIPHGRESMRDDEER